jgi:hypothetical protein
MASFDMMTCVTPLRCPSRHDATSSPKLRSLEAILTTSSPQSPAHHDFVNFVLPLATPFLPMLTSLALLRGATPSCGPTSCLHPSFKTTTALPSLSPSLLVLFSQHMASTLHGQLLRGSMTISSRNFCQTLPPTASTIIPLPSPYVQGSYLLS